MHNPNPDLSRVRKCPLSMPHAFCTHLTIAAQLLGAIDAFAVQLAMQLVIIYHKKVVQVGHGLCRENSRVEVPHV